MASSNSWKGVPLPSGSRSGSGQAPNSNRNGNSNGISPAESLDTIIHFWTHPDGRHIPAVVVAMNCTVHSEEITIPCEISMASFSLQRGIIAFYSTVVDPVSYPAGPEPELQARARYCAASFGLPPRPPFSKQFQDYKGMVEEIDKFIRSRSAHGIFCLEDDIQSVQGGFKWLYEKAGREFLHPVSELEILLVTLTHGGFTNLERYSIQRIQYYDIFHYFWGYVRSAQRNQHAPPNDMGGQACLLSFRGISELPETSYTTIGKDNRRTRVAFKKWKEHPYATLGGFVQKVQVKNYLNELEFMGLQCLACCYHRGKIAFNRLPHWDPTDKVGCCALLRLRNQLYLALDALVLNYRIRGRKWAHYPAEKPPDGYEDIGYRLWVP